MYTFFILQKMTKKRNNSLMKMQWKFYVGCKNQIMQQFKTIKKIHASKWQALPPASLQLLAEKCAMISVAQSTTEKPMMGKRLWMFLDA